MKKSIILLVALITHFQLLAQPKAIRGEMDIRGYSFEDLLSLDGEWEFYPNQLYQSVDFENQSIEKPQFINFLKPWETANNESLLEPNFGYATYRLILKADENVEELACYIPPFYSAYEFYLNGEGFAHNGKVGRKAEESEPYALPMSKSLNLKPGNNELIILVSNFSHHKGGAFQSLQVGTTSAISYRRNFGLGSNFFLAGCLLVSAITALALFWFNRRDYSALFFLLFCICSFYRAVGTDEYILHSAFPNLPFDVAIRLEYLSLFGSVAFYVYFLNNLVAYKIPSFALWTIGIVSGIMALTTLLPTYLFTGLISPYLVFICVGLLFLSVNAIIRMEMSHKMSWLTMLGAGFLGLVVISKIGAHFKLIPYSIEIDFVGYLLFLFTQTIALCIRFGRNLRESTYAAGAATKSRAEFLNTMSHELRTPMNAILGMTDFLAKTKLDSTQKEKVQTIQKNGESLLSIILDILSISELESGKIKLEKAPINIEECVRGAVNLALKEKGTKPISLEIDIDPEIPDTLLGDATRLKQIFMNLVGNAFKFTEKGSVRVEGRLKELSEKEAELSFKIIDTGIGMAASKMNGLFGAFKQAESGNTRRYGGTGLGLSVVKELLNHMNGVLNIQSQKNKGTTVMLDFKLAQPKATAKKARKGTTAAGEVDKSLRILYAEDNPVNQKLLVMMLKTFGLEIDVAENGKKAWHKALENNYHIILMDLQMPEMDGFEATKRIVSDVRSRPVIIAVTANASSADKRKCFEAGMNDFISKPIKADLLKQTIIKWQNMRKYQDDGTEDRAKIFDISA